MTDNKELWKCEVCGSLKKSTYNSLCDNCYKIKKYGTSPETIKRRNRELKIRNEARQECLDELDKKNQFLWDKLKKEGLPEGKEYDLIKPYVHLAIQLAIKHKDRLTEGKEKEE